MAEEAQPTVQHLYLQWRNGDRAAGQTMAQMFSDWYYAIATVRLGDERGRQPLAIACDNFIKGIASVPGPAELVDWAHEVVRSQTDAVGERIDGGDYPNALTQNRSPRELLSAARVGLDPPQVRLLAMTYDRATPMEDLFAEAEAQGGMPHAILEARHQLKRWLHTHAQVPFAVVPERPNLDLAPLPLYEAARMASNGEEAHFEKWLITDLDLCKDVAEFATFAHALRAGAFSAVLLPGGMRALERMRAGNPAPAAEADGGGRQPHPATAEFASADMDADEPVGNRLPWVAIGLVLFGVMAVLVLIVVLFFFVLT